jgi:hypothetical protein
MLPRLWITPAPGLSSDDRRGGVETPWPLRRDESISDGAPAAYELRRDCTRWSPLHPRPPFSTSTLPSPAATPPSAAPVSGIPPSITVGQARWSDVKGTRICLEVSCPIFTISHDWGWAFCLLCSLLSMVTSRMDDGGALLHNSDVDPPDLVSPNPTPAFFKARFEFGCRLLRVMLFWAHGVPLAVPRSSASCTRWAVPIKNATMGPWSYPAFTELPAGVYRLQHWAAINPVSLGLPSTIDLGVCIIYDRSSFILEQLVKQSPFLGILLYWYLNDGGAIWEILLERDWANFLPWFRL